MKNIDEVNLLRKASTVELLLSQQEIVEQKPINIRLINKYEEEDFYNRLAKERLLRVYNVKKDDREFIAVANPSIDMKGVFEGRINLDEAKILIDGLPENRYVEYSLLVDKNKNYVSKRYEEGRSIQDVLLSLSSDSNRIILLALPVSVFADS